MLLLGTRGRPRKLKLFYEQETRATGSDPGKVPRGPALSPRQSWTGNHNEETLEVKRLAVSHVKFRFHYAVVCDASNGLASKTPTCLPPSDIAD